MKSKAFLTVLVVLLASLLVPAMVSCGSDTAPVPGKTETNDKPIDAPQTVDEEDYKANLAFLTEELNGKLYDLDELLVIPDIENEEWQVEVTLVLSDIMTLCDAVGQLMPPDSMLDAHVAHLEAILHISDAVDAVVRGMDEADTDVLDQASAELWIASEILSQVTEPAT
ncbi:MAG: hypothetical protein J7K94_07155 [Dehalococcoidia bacterium]|nr:hypothetical protein [Dehalococcoidia bacterium]